MEKVVARTFVRLTLPSVCASACLSAPAAIEGGGRPGSIMPPTGYLLHYRSSPGIASRPSEEW